MRPLKKSAFNTVVPVDGGMACFNGITNRTAILDPAEHAIFAENRFNETDAAGLAERLGEAGILIPADRNENRLLKTYAERFVRPFQFTVELSRVCNFKCTYCYQNGTHDAGKVMPAAVFEASCRYVERVLRSGEVRDAELNFIGGEPMLHRARIAEFRNRLQPVLGQTGIPCRVVIDTNGAVLPKEFLARCEDTTFSISLTPEDDHNRNRPFLGGQGSFRTVVHNLSANREEFGVRGNQLLIRYNLDHRNANELPSFLDFLSSLEIPGMSFMVVNVENYDINPAYRNEYAAEQYSAHCGIALERMVRNNIPVHTLPYGAITPCHVFRPYSCKVFYDGRLNGCDVSDQPGEGNIFEVAGDGELRGRRSLNPLTHKMCQGDYKICNLQVFPLRQYLMSYLSASRAGKAHLFKAFEEHGAKMRRDWASVVAEGAKHTQFTEDYSLVPSTRDSFRPFVILQ